MTVGQCNHQKAKQYGNIAMGGEFNLKKKKGMFAESNSEG